MTKSAATLGMEIADGKLDPVALTESVLEKIDAHDSQDDIFTVVSRDRALAEAEAAQKRQKSGGLKSPLDGVPISWKDLYDTKGIATEAGSKLLEGRIPKSDCEVIKRAKAAGLICVGKTQTSELAFSGLGINPNARTSPNINGKGLAPGGSSSGAAASVAHEFVPIGIGSDTGGSVRIPASWNNLVGLKTTASYLPTDGVVALCPGFDTVGPLCTSVEDASLIVSIMAGEEPVLPSAKPISECKFLVNRTIMLDSLDDVQEAGFHASIDALGSAGATIEYGEIDMFQDILPLGPTLFPYEAWRQWGEQIEANPGVVYEPVENRFLSGKNLTKQQYETAWQTMLELREAYNARVADYDAVLSPTVCIGPPDVSSLLNDVELFQKTNLLALRNTRFGNMFGLCSLTLPTSTPACGLMVSAKPFSEKELVSVGLSIEKVLQG